MKLRNSLDELCANQTAIREDFMVDVYSILNGDNEEVWTYESRLDALNNVMQNNNLSVSELAFIEDCLDIFGRYSFERRNERKSKNVEQLNIKLDDIYEQILSDSGELTTLDESTFNPPDPEELEIENVSDYITYEEPMYDRPEFNYAQEIKQYNPLEDLPDLSHELIELPDVTQDLKSVKYEIHLKKRKFLKELEPMTAKIELDYTPILVTESIPISAKKSSMNELIVQAPSFFETYFGKERVSITKELKRYAESFLKYKLW